MRSRGYTLFLVVCTVLLVGVLLARSRPLDWQLKMRDDDTAPFDTKLLAETLPAFLPGRTVVRTDAPLSELLDTLRAPATVVIATPTYTPVPATLHRMLAFVRRGGTVLLVAETVGGAVHDSLGLRARDYDGGNPLNDGDSLRVIVGTDTLAVPRTLAGGAVERYDPETYTAYDESLANARDGEDADFEFESESDTIVYAPAKMFASAVGEFPDWFESFFGGDDSLREARRKWENGHYEPVKYDEARYVTDPAYRDSVDLADSLRADSAYYVRQQTPYAPAVPDTAALGVRVPLGTGQLVLFAAPRLLTNYGLLHADGDRILPGFLAYANSEGPVVWARGESPQTFTEQGPLSFVLGHPAFRPAWRTALVAVFLAMAFRLRRRQRVIPVVQKPKNETVRFARVVSRLYYLRGDHAQLGRTLRRQFYAYARDTLGVAVPPDDERFVDTVAARANASPDTVRDLLRRLDAIPDDDRMSPRDLLTLARDLDAFYAASPRGKP